jgi:hypothetical protein
MVLKKRPPQFMESLRLITLGQAGGLGSGKLVRSLEYSGFRVDFGRG